MSGQVGGVDLPCDARITMCIGAANRDPGQVADTDPLEVLPEAGHYPMQERPEALARRMQKFLLH
ncbi:MAG TPA: hypothetical protein VFC24_02435 [Casimicrobiaceae bacterium]|nr:hypothetical protein [Casimicrobiaceae bacterium]